MAFAKERASVAIAYKEEHADAQATRATVENEGMQCLLVSGEVGDEGFCRKLIA